MKKVLGIIALAACVACAEGQKAVTHPELEEVDIWSCIDALENEYTLFNESGEAFPEMARYAWADIDGDGMAELFLGSAEGEFPEIFAAFAMGGKEPQCIGFQDASHEMYFYPEGVSTCGTGLSRYNYMDRRDRLQDSRLQWELTMEETKEVYEEDEIGLGGNYIWYPEREESVEATPKEVEARLAEFTDNKVEIVPDWKPLEGFYGMQELKAGNITIQYNANRFELKNKEELGEDFNALLQNPKNANEWLRFTGYYDDGLDVMQENGNSELIAQLLEGACRENSLSVTDDPEYTVYDTVDSTIEYYNPENGHYFQYEAEQKGTPVRGIICVKPCDGGIVLVMWAQSTRASVCERFLEQFPSLIFAR